MKIYYVYVRVYHDNYLLERKDNLAFITRDKKKAEEEALNLARRYDEDTYIVEAEKILKVTALVSSKIEEVHEFTD